MRYRQTFGAVLAVAGLIVGAAPRAGAQERLIPGKAGPHFTLTAKADRILTGDGGSYLFWGFSTMGRPTYPGETLIVNEGDPVTVQLNNALAGTGQNVSLTFPGMGEVTAACTSADQVANPCVQGQLGIEAPVGAQITYSFIASRPGTFHYASASRPDLQLEMGLVGGFIVRPTMGADHAYDVAESKFDREFMFLLSEMDTLVHDMVEDALNTGQSIDDVYDYEGRNINQRLANYFPNYWFINGRNAPDSLAEDNQGRYPTQPYGSLVKVHTGDVVLMRVIGGGRDLHPFHHHGNHARVIAVDGNLQQSAAGKQAGTIDLSHMVFTVQSVPGQTVDALFSWSGEGLGWDAYGVPHAPQIKQNCIGNASAQLGDPTGYDADTHEWCPDHNKKIPVMMQDQLGIDQGEFYSGSPFLGFLGPKQVGSLQLNPDAGYTFMWHSHTEKEITNFDIFPGGIMTMLMVLPTNVNIEP
jgi:FtsP/CotA-like multicopper oxidase with cupredoxin domain